MRIQRSKMQAMAGMLLASGVAMSAFAQDASVGTLAPLSLTAPVAPSSATNTLPAPLSQTTLPVATLPTISVPVSPAAPAEVPAVAPATAATQEAAPATPSLPVVPTTPVNMPLSAVLGPLEHPNAAGNNPQDDKVYSYGTSQSSILFLPTQVDNMRKAIHNYESSAKPGSTTFVAPEPLTITPATPVEVAISEPPAYPVFYLASIAYHTPSDWSLWISGHKITSRKNDTDLAVLSVSPESASFSWAPAYMPAINTRNTKKLFAPVDPVKHRLSKTQNINLNNKNNTVTFSLRPNQSFAVGYFTMFEGYIATPTMPPMPGMKDAVAVSPTAEQTAAALAKAANSAPSIPSSLEGRTVMTNPRDLFPGLTGGTAHVVQRPLVPAPTVATPSAPATPANINP